MRKKKSEVHEGKALGWGGKKANWTFMWERVFARGL